MDRHLEFNREEFRRIVTQVRPDFYDRDHYFLIVEIDGPKARCKVVESIITTTVSLEGTDALEATIEDEPEVWTFPEGSTESVPVKPTRKRTKKTE